MAPRCVEKSKKMSTANKNAKDKLPDVIGASVVVKAMSENKSFADKSVPRSTRSRVALENQKVKAGYDGIPKSKVVTEHNESTSSKEMVGNIPFENKSVPRITRSRVAVEQRKVKEGDAEKSANRMLQMMFLKSHESMGDK